MAQLEFFIIGEFTNYHLWLKLQFTFYNDYQNWKFKVSLKLISTFSSSYFI